MASNLPEIASLPGASRMRAWALELPDQLSQTMEQAAASGWPPHFSSPSSIYLGGMGGSAMACSLTRSILAERLGIPCVVGQDPELPAFIGPGTLAGVVTYSGETWESRHVLAGLIDRGAQTFLVTSGGRILTEAGLDARTVFRVPPGYAPRAALGRMLVPVLLAAAGPWGEQIRRDLAESVSLLRDECELWQSGLALPGRDPRVLAAALRDRMTCIYTPEESFRAVGVRWKSQIQENAKQMAAEAAFPELVHNEILGWDFATAHRFVFVVLELPGASGIERRLLTESALAELSSSGADVLRVSGRGESRTARLLTHVALADMVSLELASLLGVDPLPIPAIERVKKACGKELLR